MRTLQIATLDFDPILHEGYHGNQPAEPNGKAAQDFISWAEHVVVIYPMWQFGVPALLKGFCERTLTPYFHYGTNDAKIARSRLKTTERRERGLHRDHRVETVIGGAFSEDFWQRFVALHLAKWPESRSNA